MTLTKKLTKIGNSLGLILPNDILNLAGIDSDAEVQIEAKPGKITLTPINLEDHKVMKTFLSVLKDYDEAFEKLAQ